MLKLRKQYLMIFLVALSACQTTRVHREKLRAANREVASNGEALVWGQNAVSRHVVRLMNLGGLSCSGVLLNATTVLTAAHCFDGIRYQNTYDDEFGLQIGIADNNLPSEKRQYARFKAAYIPKQYSFKNKSAESEANAIDQYDIGIGILDTPIFPEAPSPKLSDSSLVPGKTYYFAGYGINQDVAVDEEFGTLRFAPVQVESDKVSGIVASKSPSRFKICVGDSGGPLLDSDTGAARVFGVATGIVANTDTPESNAAANVLLNLNKDLRIVVSGSPEERALQERITKYQKILCKESRGRWVSVSGHKKFLLDPKSEGQLVQPGVMRAK